MARRVTVLVLAVLSTAHAVLAEDCPPPESKPPYERLLTWADAAADQSHGVACGKDEPALAVPAADAKLTLEADYRPFAHPRYWAAFILIGDPE
jgi:hypothetical protein